MYVASFPKIKNNIGKKNVDWWQGSDIATAGTSKKLDVCCQQLHGSTFSTRTHVCKAWPQEERGIRRERSRVGVVGGGMRGLWPLGRGVLYKLFRIFFSFFLLFFPPDGLCRAAAEALPGSGPVFVPANSTCSHNCTHTHTHTPYQSVCTTYKRLWGAAVREIQDAGNNSIGLDFFF